MTPLEDKDLMTSGPYDCRPEDMTDHLARLAAAGPEAIEKRLGWINQEWSVGRAVKGSVALLILAGLALSYFVSPWFLLLPLATGLLLAQYLFSKRSVLGDLFCALGLRTGEQIDCEKLALRTLRGDFKHLPTVHEIEDRQPIERLEDEGGIVVDPDYAKRDLREAVREVVDATHK